MQNEKKVTICLTRDSPIRLGERYGEIEYRVIERSRGSNCNVRLSHLLISFLYLITGIFKTPGLFCNFGKLHERYVRNTSVNCIFISCAQWRHLANENHLVVLATISLINKDVLFMDIRGVFQWAFFGGSLAMHESPADRRYFPQWNTCRRFPGGSMVDRTPLHNYSRQPSLQPVH